MVELAVRGKIIDFSSDPIESREYNQALRYYEDGVLCIHSGKVIWCGPWSEGKKYIDVHSSIRHYFDDIIIPGFVDTHAHYPQLEAISSYVKQLLESLENSPFPAEMDLTDSVFCQTVAKLFIRELLTNGITSSLVYGAVTDQSINAMFDEATKLDFSIIAGKVWMDRNASPNLEKRIKESYLASEKLIKKWHNNGRSRYAITPRFLAASNTKEFRLVRSLEQKNLNTYVHTHLCENHKEVEMVKELFPEHTGYLDVYQRYGLTGACSRIAFCPTSNLFLANGLFGLKKPLQYNIEGGLGMEVGGSSFELLKKINEAYKSCQLKTDKLSPLESLYLATIGGAKALNLEKEIGNFDVGKFADFVVMTPAITPIQHWRLKDSLSIDDILFMLFLTGDEHNVKATYVNGKLRHGS